MPVVEIKNSAAFVQLIGDENRDVIVDFTASWCGPCRVIAPAFAKLADENPSFLFGKVDIDDLKELAKLYNINSVPSFVRFSKSQPVRRCTGANINKIKELLTV